MVLAAAVEIVMVAMGTAVVVVAASVMVAIVAVDSTGEGVVVLAMFILLST